MQSVSPIKQDRDSIYLDYTRSICPICKVLVDAQIFQKDNKIIMKKRCSYHGLFECLISSDADMYRRAFRFNKPGTLPREFATIVDKGCPYDCGLCPDHQQHSCVGIIEVTENCNLRCPTCFSDSTVGKSLDLKTIRFMLDSFIRYEGNPEVLMLSGGEPTVHPKLNEIIAMAKDKGMKYVMLNTNGVRIANDESFVKEIAGQDVYVYLQFDGFLSSTYTTLRGIDLKETKMKALRNLSSHKINTVLVCTVQRGVNESELGEITDFALKDPNIRGVVFQPTFYSGRHPDFDPMDRVTTPDVVKGISAQSRFQLKPSDFMPIPCCFPNCSTATYIYMDEDKAIPLPRIVDPEEYLDYFANRAIADLDFIKKREGLESLFSASSVVGSDSMASNFCDICNISDINSIQENVKMVLIQPFMDAWNFDVRRVMKCCVSEILPDGRMIPFCAYNNLYRGK